MAEFNYTEYLKNNPLLQEEVKDKLLTESQKINELESDIISYIADTYIQNAKGGDRRYTDFLDLNVRDAVQDVLGILQSPDHPLHDETKKEYSIVKRDKAKGLFEEKSSKTTVSELKAQIKEMILASLAEEEPVAEAEEDEEVEVDIEDEIEADAELEMEPEMDAAPEGGMEGLTADEKEIQDSLKLAYDNAVAIGDQKLADQIGNSITFFTRTHVVER